MNIKYIETELFLTSSTIGQLLEGVVASQVIITTITGVDPAFYKKYTMLLNPSLIDYIREKCGYNVSLISTNSDHTIVQLAMKDVE